MKRHARIRREARAPLAGTAHPPGDVVNRDQALPQFGLPASATQRQIQEAYESAVAEIELLTRNIPAQSLSASFRQARADLERAYEVLRQPPDPEPGVKNPLSVKTTPAPVAKPSRKTPKADKRVKPVEKPLATPAGPAQRPAAASDENRAASKDVAKSSRELEAARAAAASARREVEESRQAVSRLRAEAMGWNAEVERLTIEARALHEAIGQVRAEATRELEAIQKARKTGDEVVKSLYRSEEEANAAATHAEAYRDGAMFALQAAEKLLRELDG